MSRRSWTSSEQEALRVLAGLGAAALAEAFGRSPKSVRRKAEKLGVSLRRRSLGAATGPLCPATLRRVRELTAASLCPACGKRFVGVKATGLCGACHLRHLKTAHEEALASAEAQRALWTSRSRLHRCRRRLAAEELSASGNGDAAVIVEPGDTGATGQ